MIIHEHTQLYAQFKDYYHSPMLALGNQQSTVGDLNTFFGVESYSTLDPDNGTYTDDLTGDTSHLDEKFGTVFNIGTIEHIWDAHKAWCNAAKMVRVGGYFLSASPAYGYRHHGIHVTSEWAIIKFFEKNGFTQMKSWLQNDEGVNGMTGPHLILWSAFRKDRHVTEFEVPLQIYANNRSING